MSSKDTHDPAEAGAHPVTPVSESDASLIRKLQLGTLPERDQERLFKRFYKQVYGAFRRRGFASEDAEDLAQDTLVQAFNKIDNLRQPEQFSSWLFSISVNIFRNELRRRSRHKPDVAALSFDAVDDDGAPEISLGDDAPGPDDGLLDKERRQLLRRATEDLPPQMQQCVRFRFEHGLKYREIAAVLKISIDTVKAHLAQARKRLADKLSHEVKVGNPQ